MIEQDQANGPPDREQNLGWNKPAALHVDGDDVLRRVFTRRDVRKDSRTGQRHGRDQQCAPYMLHDLTILHGAGNQPRET